MRDVLFLAYYFPPTGGAGVQRSQKFARYLPELGFRPVVVAGPAGGQGRWTPEDRALAEELPADLPLWRPDSQPPPASRLDARLARWLGRPPAAFRWWARTLVDTGLVAARASRPQLIYVSLSPFEGLAPALELGRRLDLPVLADLRDPWAFDEVAVYPSALHRRLERARMGRLLARADRVLLNTPEALGAVREAFGALPADHFDCLTNGYDAQDFQALPERPADGRLRIVHTGYLHAARGLAHRSRSALQRFLGGSLGEVDFLGRSHYYLLQALERLQGERPELAARIELQLIGVLSPEDEELVRRSSAAERVRLLGYRDHRSSVRALQEADLLFLPMHALGPGRRARIVPAKTYEYLASGRPILAALPPGDARDFLEAAGGARFTAPDDVAGLARALEQALQAAPEPDRPRGPAIECFERRHLTAQLARHFTELLGSPPRGRRSGSATPASHPA